MKSCLLIALLLSGCSSVVMKEPFPDSPLTQQDIQALRGTWQLEDAVFHVDFTSNNAPRMASVRWEDDAFSLVEYNMHIAKRDGTFYFSVEALPEDDVQGHFFAALCLRNDEILIWGPDIDFFKSMVASNRLEGSVRQDEHTAQISITAPAAQVLELISTNAAAIDYEVPVIANKID